jgi:hypothetical protein
MQVLLPEQTQIHPSLHTNETDTTNGINTGKLFPPSIFLNNYLDIAEEKSQLLICCLSLI